MKLPSSASYVYRASLFADVMQSNAMTGDDICQIIALSLIPDTLLDGVSMVDFNKNDSFSITSSYGLLGTMDIESKKFIARNDAPLVKAMKTNSVVFTHDISDMSVAFTTNRENIPLDQRLPAVAVPLNRSGVVFGAIILVGSSLRISTEMIEFLELIASIVALSNHFRVDIKKGTILSTIDEKSRSKGLLKGLTLTLREAEIQILMKDSLTNDEIAQKLGFSSSTIRKDAVSLFAKLGVSTRKDAADLI